MPFCVFVCIADGVGGEKGEFVDTSPLLLSENGVVYETEGKSGVIDSTCMTVDT